MANTKEYYIEVKFIIKAVNDASECIKVTASLDF